MINKVLSHRYTDKVVTRASNLNQAKHLFGFMGMKEKMCFLSLDIEGRRIIFKNEIMDRFLVGFILCNNIYHFSSKLLYEEAITGILDCKLVTHLKPNLFCFYLRHSARRSNEIFNRLFLLQFNQTGFEYFTIDPGIMANFALEDQTGSKLVYHLNFMDDISQHSITDLFAVPKFVGNSLTRALSCLSDLSFNALNENAFKMKPSIKKSILGRKLYLQDWYITLFEGQSSEKNHFNVNNFGSNKHKILKKNGKKVQTIGLRQVESIAKQKIGKSQHEFCLYNENNAVIC